MKKYRHLALLVFFISVCIHSVHADPLKKKSEAFDVTTNRIFALYGNLTQWVVKQSDDAGNTWHQIDKIEQSCKGLISSYPCLSPQKIIFQEPSTLIAVGGATEGKYLREWVVRWSRDGGQTWHMGKKMSDRFPVYAFDVHPTRDANLFQIQGYVTGFSSYKIGVCGFDIDLNQFVGECTE